MYPVMFCSNHSSSTSNLTMASALFSRKKHWRLMSFSALTKQKSTVSISAVNPESIGEFPALSYIVTSRTLKLQPFKFVLRVFPLACRAMGVCPTLALSHSLVQFGPTAVGDHSTALLYLTYNQTVRNQSKQRPSAGARLFSFTPPQDSSIRITPAAGRLLPGKVRRGGGGHLSSSG